MKKNNAKPANPLFYWILGLSVIIPYGHTFATMLLETRENPEIVARLMGHAKVTTTLLVYSHVVSQDVFEETAKTLDGTFAKITEKKEKNQ